MVKHKKILFLMPLILLLSACTEKEFIALPENIQSHIKSTDVYIIECQKEMQADIENPNITAVTGGGLIPALIDCVIMSYREDCANDALGCVQQELKKYNLEERFKNKIEYPLKNSGWLNVDQMSYVKDFNGQAQEEILKKVKTDAVLTVQFKYKLNPDFNILTGTLYFTLYPISPSLKDIIKTEDTFNTPIFKFNLSAIASLSTQEKGIDERAKQWAQDDGAYLKQSLENIVDQLCFSVERILKNPGNLPNER